MDTRYVKATRNGQVYCVAYVGQSDAVILQLMAGLGCTDVSFVSEEEYTAATAR